MQSTWGFLVSDGKGKYNVTNHEIKDTFYSAGQLMLKFTLI